MADSALLAAESANLSSTKYKQYFDLKTQDRSFDLGGEVLVLLPDSHNKLLMSWKGPFKVLERKNKVDYLIDYDGNKRLFHINLLKQYFRRAVNNIISIDEEQCIPNQSLPFLGLYLANFTAYYHAGVYQVEVTPL